MVWRVWGRLHAVLELGQERSREGVDVGREGRQAGVGGREPTMDE
jgi:hypothetical protein